MKSSTFQFLNSPGVPTLMRSHRLTKTFSITFCILSILICTHSEAADSISSSGNNDWHYYTGSEPPPRNWTHVGFNDSRWNKGLSNRVSIQSGAIAFPHYRHGNDKILHARHPFRIVSPSIISKLYLSVECNGPFIAYLNGIEVIRNSTSIAGQRTPSGRLPAEKLDISGFSHELLSDTNVLSLQCQQDSAGNPDFNFNAAFEIHEFGK